MKRIPTCGCMALLAAFTLAANTRGADGPAATNAPSSAIAALRDLQAQAEQILRNTAAAPGQIDPATGLPADQWKDPNWQEPEKVLTEVRYDGLPVSEVARNLRLLFTNAFDVLLPGSWQNANNGIPVTFDPQSITINIELKNVTASEVFNAMNLVFETQNTPAHWELKMNGNRPTAVLRVLPALVPVPSPEPPEKSRRMVIFVGEILGDEKHKGMTMEQLMKTISDVFQMSYGDPKSKIQFHKEAQLLIVSGTTSEVNFVQETLQALNNKTQLERRVEMKAEPKIKTEDPKPH